MEKRLQAKREEIKLPQTPQDKAMMRAMRIAGKIDGEIKVKDSARKLEKLRMKNTGMNLSELSKLENDLQRTQDENEISFTSNNPYNYEKLKQSQLTGTGIYEPNDPNLIDKLLDGEKPIMIEKQTPIPDKNLNPIPMKSKFDIFNPTDNKIDPLLKEAMEQNKSKELLKRLHTDENGRIAITDLNLQEKILHHPDDVEVKKIGTNKVALVGKSSGHDYFRILGNFSPGTGIPLAEHIKKVHGDDYQREPMEFASSIEDQNEEKNELKEIEKRDNMRKERDRSRSRKLQRSEWYHKNKNNNS